MSYILLSFFLKKHPIVFFAGTCIPVLSRNYKETFAAGLAARPRPSPAGLQHKASPSSGQRHQAHCRLNAGRLSAGSDRAPATSPQGFGAGANLPHRTQCTGAQELQGTGPPWLAAAPRPQARTGAVIGLLKGPEVTFREPSQGTDTPLSGTQGRSVGPAETKWHPQARGVGVEWRSQPAGALRPQHLETPKHSEADLCYPWQVSAVQGGFPKRAWPRLVPQLQQRLSPVRGRGCHQCHLPRRKP